MLIRGRSGVVALLLRTGHAVAIPGLAGLLRRIMLPGNKWLLRCIRLLRCTRLLCGIRWLRGIVGLRTRGITAVRRAVLGRQQKVSDKFAYA